MPTDGLHRTLVGLARQGKSSLSSIVSQANAARRLAFKEIELLSRTPKGTKFAMWRRGFRSDAAETYGFDGEADYLPDIPYLLRGERINGPFRLVLDDKLVFHHVMRSHAELLPRHLARVVRGRILPLGDDPFPTTGLADLVEHSGPVVVKARTGSSGRGLHFVEARAGGFSIDEKPHSRQSLDALAAELHDHLICERVFPHPTIRAMAPHTTNCLRVLTLWDDRSARPFLPFASLSLGTRKTLPRDIQGLSAPVDVETGRLGRARDYDTKRRVDLHPDTQERISGVVVPHWDVIRRRVLEVAEDLSFLLQIGWDVVVTEDGCKIIEGNNHPGLVRHQVHAPMLRDPRVRRFYELHGIV